MPFSDKLATAFEYHAFKGTSEKIFEAAKATVDPNIAPAKSSTKVFFIRRKLENSYSTETFHNISYNVRALAKLTGCIMCRRPQPVNLGEPQRTANALLCAVAALRYFKILIISVTLS